MIEPHALGQWKFIPEEWVEPAAKRDYEYLFGKWKIIAIFAVANFKRVVGT